MHRRLFLPAVATAFASTRALAADLPIRLLSARVQVLSKELQALTSENTPIVLLGEALASDLVIGDIAKSYEFCLYNAAKKSDTGQSHSGLAYVAGDGTTKERPSGRYQFLLRYWIDKGARFPVALYFKGKPISNVVKVQGTYEGTF